jgi:DnaK suppressor protein
MAKTKQAKATNTKAASAPKSVKKPVVVKAAASDVSKSAKAMPKTKPSAVPAKADPKPQATEPKLPAIKAGDVKMTPFLKKQRERLLALRDSMLDSMAGVAKDNLRSRAEGSEASAFGMHQADAGSDAYDRDFALSLLSQEQDALYEIEEALKRIDAGTYGICEMSGKSIPHPRLEAIPFARCTVECQAQIEKQRKAVRVRQPVTSLFGLTEEEAGGSEGEEEEAPTDLKD